MIVIVIIVVITTMVAIMMTILFTVVIPAVGGAGAQAECRSRHQNQNQFFHVVTFLRWNNISTLQAGNSVGRLPIALYEFPRPSRHTCRRRR
jgi:hypothetical protein